MLREFGRVVEKGDPGTKTRERERERERKRAVDDEFSQVDRGGVEKFQREMTDCAGSLGRSALHRHFLSSFSSSLPLTLSLSPFLSLCVLTLSRKRRGGSLSSFKRTARKTMATKATRPDRPTTNAAADPFKPRHFNFRFLRSPALCVVITLMRLLIILMRSVIAKPKPSTVFETVFPLLALSLSALLFFLVTVYNLIPLLYCNHPWGCNSI